MTPLPDLIDAWRRIPQAMALTRRRADVGALRRSLADHPFLVIAASGNSVYPARYLEWLLGASGSVVTRLVTPLEYALGTPRHRHCVLLVSQGARRRDSWTIMELARRTGAPLFVLCGEAALESATVAAELPRHHVFTTATLGEHAFLNLMGTGAAFAAAHDIARGLGAAEAAECGVLDDLVKEEPTAAPHGGAVLALHGLSSRCAAEAFAGYHSESLGAATCYDMKNFTHGVWRGLGETGRASVTLFAERRVEALARFLCDRLAPFHACEVVTAPPRLHPSIEPVALYLEATGRWIARARSHAARHPDWSPLTVDKTRWAPLLDLTRYDVGTLSAE